MATATQSLEHPLSAAQQTRNVIVFAACTCLQYVAAPVLYVGMTQASLCRRLGATPKVSNLPETAFFVMTVTPVLLAWWLPGVAVLKRLLITCYLAAGGALALVSLTLVAPVSNDLRLATVILQGAVSGAAMPTAIALLWEAIGRGVPESRRGLALGLAFGIGPFLAFAASLATQELLTGTLWGWRTAPLEPPWNFIAVFGGAVPLMIAAALFAPSLVIPPAAENPVREPFLAGLRAFLTTPVLARATAVTILLYVGNTITANMNLHTENVLGADPEAYVGYQNALRFFCKGVVGLLLGWILTRSNPRAGILITGLLFVASQVWAIFIPGIAYLFAFGIYGAGELVGVYAPNYILSASSPRRLRQNMAYVTMMMAPAAPAGYLFGAIATNSMLGSAAGFRLSFVVCAGILIVGLFLAVALLPKRPVPDQLDGVHQMPLHQVVVIGVGSIGERHVRCFQATGRAEISIVETRAVLARDVSQRYGVPAYGDLEAALAQQPTMSVIATPAPLHVPQATTLVEAGLHVLIEKPLSISLAGVSRLQELAGQRQTTIGMAYVYRAFPMLAALRQALRSGRFGAPQQITAVCGQHFPTYRPAYRETYYTDRRTGGGAIQDALTHIINLAEWLLGPVDRVVADAAHLVLPGVEVEDTVHVLARHGAVLGSYALNQHQTPNESAITVICDEGTVRAEVHANRWLWMKKPGDAWQEEAFGPADRDAAFIAQAHAILDAVEGKAPLLCPLDEGIQTLKVNLAILESVDRGSWVSITH